MKTTVQTETYICDACGKQEDYATACTNCGKHHCFDCRQKKLGQDYPHAVYFSGSGDGYYCNPCDGKLFKSGKDKQWNAYRAIFNLREEANRWSETFKLRVESAEAELKKFAKD